MAVAAPVMYMHSVAWVAASPWSVMHMPFEP